MTKTATEGRTDGKVTIELNAGTLWTAAVANVFEKSRGLALGITFGPEAVPAVPVTAPVSG